MKLRKITLEVFCLEEDAQQVADSLYNNTKHLDPSWFADHPCQLIHAEVRIKKLTRAEKNEVEWG